MSEEHVVPLLPEEAKRRLQELGATIMFEKVLTTSDANGSGRIVIPKSVAEANFPLIDNQNGIILSLTDVFGKKYGFRYRFWINNASRMYLLEGTQELLVKFKLGVGDVLVFARHPSTDIYVCGRKGTKEDSTRRTPAKRSAESKRKSAREAKLKKAATAAAPLTDQPEGPLAATTVAAADSAVEEKPLEAAPQDKPLETAPVKPKPAPAAPRSKRSQHRSQDVVIPTGQQDVNSMYSYWNALSLPARRDGVFRAVPHNATGIEANKVVAQHGHWSAVVSMAGELYQAFFDSRDAAAAAFEAALQTVP